VQVHARASGAQLTPSSSTSKMRVALGGMTPARCARVRHTSQAQGVCQLAVHPVMMCTRAGRATHPGAQHTLVGGANAALTGGGGVRIAHTTLPRTRAC
jgi:hypothetical protein